MLLIVIATVWDDGGRTDYDCTNAAEAARHERLDLCLQRTTLRDLDLAG